MCAKGNSCTALCTHCMPIILVNNYLSISFSSLHVLQTCGTRLTKYHNLVMCAKGFRALHNLCTHCMSVTSGHLQKK